MGRDTHTCFALGEGLQDPCHTCSHTLCTQGIKTQLRFSIWACHLQLTYCLNQAWYRDTPPSLGTGSTRTTRRSSFNGAIRTRSENAAWRCHQHSLTRPCARPQAVLPACPLALQLRCLPSSLKQCCPLPRGSRSGGGATRTRLPFLHTCPDGASHAS